MLQVLRAKGTLKLLGAAANSISRPCWVNMLAVHEGDTGGLHPDMLGWR